MLSVYHEQKNLIVHENKTILCITNCTRCQEVRNDASGNHGNGAVWTVRKRAREPNFFLLFERKEENILYVPKRGIFSKFGKSRVCVAGHSNSCADLCGIGIGQVVVSVHRVSIS